MSELNKHRQTKEYKLSDQGGEYTVPYKGAEPQRQTDLNGDHGESLTEVTREDRKDKRNAYHKQHIERDYVEEAKIEIADKVFKQLNDVIFEMVCEEMSNKYVFQSSNYLTEAGYEMFEDQWFEFYHEHHGDILAQIQNKLIY